MLAKPCAWGSPSWSTNSLWIALNSPLNAHGSPGTLTHIKMFLSSVLKRERSCIAAVLLFCVIEELLQHDRFCHLYIFCVIQLWWSCLSTFTNEEYSLRVWLKLQLPGVLHSKPSRDLAIITCLIWHSGGCSLSLLLPICTLYRTGFPASACIWTEVQTRHQRALQTSISAKRVKTAVVSGQKMWWGIERTGIMWEESGSNSSNGENWRWKEEMWWDPMPRKNRNENTDGK